MLTAMLATTDLRWTPAPTRPRAMPSVVDVWRADLAAVGDELEDLLCPQERKRASRIAPERNRVLWARSRGVLRALLASYLDADPRAMRFVLGPHGKPALAREEAGTGVDTRAGVATGAGEATGADEATRGGEATRANEGLRFNLSHSGALMLVAVTAGREVGVDVERPRKRYTTEFLRTWVAHEAALKCRGDGLTGLGSGLTGLGSGLTSLGSGFAGRGSGLTAGAPEDFQHEGLLAGGSQGDLWTAALDAGPQAAAAAVAVERVEGLQCMEGVEGLQRVEGGQCEVRCWEWRDQE